MPEFDLSGIDLSLDTGAAPAEAGAAPAGLEDEVATKLDLARAYVEMGDAEGAREILNEVAKEGNAGQQAEAKTMLAAL
jgi:pilus assembly protein FimV